MLDNLEGFLSAEVETLESSGGTQPPNQPKRNEMEVCGQCTLERSTDLNMANEMPLKASGGLREMTGSAVSLTCCERRLAVSTYRPGWW